jgi:hypothetical protein
MLTAAFHATSGADFRIYPELADPRHSVPGRKEAIARPMRSS